MFPSDTLFTPTLAGWDIASDGGWSLWRSFGFNLPYLALNLISSVLFSFLVKLFWNDRSFHHFFHSSGFIDDFFPSFEKIKNQKIVFQNFWFQCKVLNGIEDNNEKIFRRLTDTVHHKINITVCGLYIDHPPVQKLKNPSGFNFKNHENNEQWKYH